MDRICSFCLYTIFVTHLSALPRHTACARWTSTMNNLFPNSFNEKTANSSLCRTDPFNRLRNFNINFKNVDYLLMSSHAKCKNGKKTINRRQYWALKNKKNPKLLLKFTHCSPMWSQFACSRASKANILGPIIIWRHLFLFLNPPAPKPI